MGRPRKQTVPVPAPPAYRVIIDQSSITVLDGLQTKWVVLGPLDTAWTGYTSEAAADDAAALANDAYQIGMYVGKLQGKVTAVTN